MPQKLYLFGFCIAGLLILGIAQKRVTFLGLKCDNKSNKLSRLSCFLENMTAFAVEATVGDKDLNRLSGLVEAQLSHYQPKGVKMSVGRMDICKMLTTLIRPSMLSFLYEGIQKAEHNLPSQCPIKRNGRYMMRHLQFDPTNMPLYLPEYNFTISVKFFGNNGNLFDLLAWGSFCEIGNEVCLGKKNQLNN